MKCLYWRTKYGIRMFKWALCFGYDIQNEYLTKVHTNTFTALCRGAFNWYCWKAIRLKRPPFFSTTFEVDSSSISFQNMYIYFLWYDVRPLGVEWLKDLFTLTSILFWRGIQQQWGVHPLRLSSSWIAGRFLCPKLCSPSIPNYPCTGRITRKCCQYQKCGSIYSQLGKF